MRSKRFRLNSDKTECSLVKQNNNKCRKIDIKSVMLGNIPALLSNSVRNLELVFDNLLNLDEQIINVKRKVIVNLINISRITKVID